MGGTLRGGTHCSAVAWMPNPWQMPVTVPLLRMAFERPAACTSNQQPTTGQWLTPPPNPHGHQPVRHTGHTHTHTHTHTRATKRTAAYSGRQQQAAAPRGVDSPCQASHGSRKRGGNIFRVGIFLDFVWLTTRTPYVAYARRAKRNRIDRHRGEIERLATRPATRA